MNKLLAATLFFLAICCAGMAQEQPVTLNLGAHEPASYYEEIPYEVVNGKLVVTVTINGKPRKFIWDTGAPVMILGKLFKELEPPVINTIPVYDAFGKKDSMQVVSLERLTIGSVDFVHTAALLVAENKGLECLEADGLIGSNLLRDAIVQINSVSKKIIITNIDNKVATGKHGIDIFKTPAQSNPFIKIGLPSNVSLQLLFDTGDDGFLSISNKNYDFIKKEKSKSLRIIAEGHGNNAYGIHGSEENTDKFRLMAEEIKLGKTSFKHVTAETMNDADSRIGAELLSYGIVTLDYKNAKFYFQPFDDKKKFDLQEKRWQIEPTADENKIMVGMTWGEAKDLAHAGEEITAIDGRATDAIDLCELFREGILPKDKDRVVLKIKDATGKEREVINKKE